MSSPPLAGLEVIEAAYETLGQLVHVFKPNGHTNRLSGRFSTPNGRKPATRAPRRFGNNIGYPRAFKKRADVAAPFKVADLCKAYNFPTGLTGGGVIGILEFGGGYTQADLDQFSQLNGLPQILPTPVSVNGGQNSPGSDDDDEVLLDIQVAAASYFYCTGQLPTIKVFFAPNEFASFAAVFKAAADAGCDVLSISFGADEDSFTQDEADQIEAAAEDATSRGCVLFAAAGDNSSDDGGTGANVDLPAGCPHVVGCGGTKKTSSSEIVWGKGIPNGEGTGGGYSIFFPPQDFQIGAPPSPGQPGRMVPDVAADAAPETGYLIVINGQETTIGGTSAVSPLYSGLFASFGQKLGFVTPTLFLHPEAFVDITQGSNGDFQASVGPDPCTGLGVPNGAALAAIFTGSSANARLRRK